MRIRNKVIEFPDNKKNYLIERSKKELKKLTGGSLQSFAEDIYYTFIVMELADQELELLLSMENVLEMLAVRVQDDELYDILIEGTINRFLGRGN